MTFNSDKSGWALPNSKEDIVAPKNGNNVTLTIDQKIQAFLEESMTQVANKYKPKKIIATVVDPKTGKVLAMGQRPSFNLNELDITNYNNDVISYAFEPGSTMKIFTLAAAIEENKFDPNEKFQSGSYKVTSKDDAIHDNNRYGWGSISYLEGVRRSSNVAFAKLANEKMGFEKFREYLTKFGFDGATGIDLPYETSGKIQYTWPIEKATTPYGQGTAITPIQQIQAATAIANNGEMMKPQVIDKIVNHDTGEVIRDVTPEVVSNLFLLKQQKKSGIFLKLSSQTKKREQVIDIKLMGIVLLGKQGLQVFLIQRAAT